MINIFGNLELIKKINDTLLNHDFHYHDVGIFIVKSNNKVIPYGYLASIFVTKKSIKQAEPEIKNKDEELKNVKLAKHKKDEKNSKIVVISQTKRQEHKNRYKQKERYSEWKISIEKQADKKETKSIELSYEDNANKKNLSTPEIIDFSQTILAEHNKKLVDKYLIWIKTKNIKLDLYENKVEVEELFELYMKIGEDEINELIKHENLKKNNIINPNSLIKQLKMQWELKFSFLQDCAYIESYLRNYYKIITNKEIPTNMQDQKSLSNVMDTYKLEHKNLNFKEDLLKSFKSLVILRNYLTHNSIYNGSLKNLKKEIKESATAILNWIKEN